MLQSLKLLRLACAAVHQYGKMFLFNASYLRIQNEYALDHIAQFPHVARPRILHEGIQRLAADFNMGAPVLTPEAQQKFLNQYGNIFPAVAQRRYKKGNDVQAV